MHVAYSAPSSEHAKVEPFSLEVNSKLALAEFVSAGGPSVIEVCGATVSTVQVKVAGL